MNTLAAEVLFNKIAEIAEIDSNTNILDVCCGTGTIGLSLAKVKKNSQYQHVIELSGCYLCRNVGACTG